MGYSTLCRIAPRPGGGTGMRARHRWRCGKLIDDPEHGLPIWKHREGAQ